MSIKYVSNMTRFVASQLAISRERILMPRIWHKRPLKCPEKLQKELQKTLSKSFKKPLKVLKYTNNPFYRKILIEFK